MRPGGVIVDLAGAGGGNCELSRPRETVVRHGVTIAAPLNLASTVPEHSSQLFARNVLALLELMLVDGRLAIDLADDVLSAACVSRGNAISQELTT
jgi:NAD(P) transhydrogenase subunit alpha